jgi:5-methylcytosine-specific restriction protein A
VVTRRYDYNRSDAANAYRAWYHTKRWRELRANQLAREPLCRMCMADGIITAANVCDHITAHKGDDRLFWDPVNFQSLCKPHHDRDKASIEMGRGPRDAGSDGWPIGSPGKAVGGR